MMKNKILFLIAFIAVFYQYRPVHSQELGFKKWEVGTDLLWLLNKDRSKPISFFALKLRTKQKTKGFGYRKFGYRFWLGFSLRNYNNKITRSGNNNPATKFTNKHYLIYNRLGYQWITTKNKIKIIYGFDITNLYSYKEYIVISPSSNPQFDEFQNLFRVGLSPFAGLAYDITSKIKISAESNVGFTYFIQNIKTSPSGNPNDEIITQGIRGFELNSNPLNTINIGFVF